MKTVLLIISALAAKPPRKAKRDPVSTNAMRLFDEGRSHFPLTTIFASFAIQKESGNAAAK